MLQSLRENLKGTVAVFVITIFVVPLVLFGVEQLFVGSVGGTDAATVNGEGIPVRELQRELAMEKQRLQNQFNLEPNAPQLQDDALSGPVLRRLVQRQALLDAARENGMGAPKNAVWREIAAIEAFQVDGKFDNETFKRAIAGAYTPATFVEAASRDFILGQLNSGLQQSGFVTDLELSLVASITQQARSFFTATIPADSVEEIEVTEQEVETFYQDNTSRYQEPERVTINYIELSLDDLAADIEPQEEMIRSVYEDEVENFDPDPQYTVAHILIEEGENSKQEIAEVQAKLAEGESFESLVESYSDDLGSKQSGGELGLLVEDAFPESFVEAAQALAEGEVSQPIATDAGTHFIKVLDVANVNPPSFDERRDAIARLLSRQLAQEQFVNKMAAMDELTFGADSLEQAASELDLEVMTSEPFGRQGGDGFASDRKVVDAAFQEDVLQQGQNSAVLELGGKRAAVVRVVDHQQAWIKPLSEVENQIRETLRTNKIAEKLEQVAQDVIAAMSGAEDYAQQAEALGVDYQFHENVERSNQEVSPFLLRTVFSLPRPDQEGSAVFEQLRLPEGDQAVIGLVEVQSGSLEDLNTDERTGITQQLKQQQTQAELAAFEEGVVNNADVDMPQ